MPTSVLNPPPISVPMTTRRHVWVWPSRIRVVAPAPGRRIDCAAWLHISAGVGFALPREGGHDRGSCRLTGCYGRPVRRLPGRRAQRHAREARGASTVPTPKSRQSTSPKTASNYVKKGKTCKAQHSQKKLVLRAWLACASRPMRGQASAWSPKPSTAAPHPRIGPQALPRRGSGCRRRCRKAAFQCDLPRVSW